MIEQKDIVKTLRVSADAISEIKHIFEKLEASEDILEGLDNVKFIIHAATNEIIKLQATIDAMHNQNVRNLEDSIGAKDPDPNGENIENYCKIKRS